MMDCWKQDPDARPSFQELVEYLEQLMLHEVDYFEFHNFNECKDYYQVPESSESEEDDESEMETSF